MLPVRGGHVSVFCLIPLFSFNFHCNVPPPGVIRIDQGEFEAMKTPMVVELRIVIRISFVLK